MIHDTLHAFPHHLTFTLPFRSFPNNYWDKFVKKKVRQKYSETYDFDSISLLLGMETTMSFKEEEVKPGLIGM